MDYDDERERTRYLFEWCGRLLTAFEVEVHRADVLRRDLRLSGPDLGKWLRGKTGEMADAIEEALADVDAFYRQTCTRALAEHGPDVIRRCPKCARVLNTPTAQQCFTRGHVWHPPDGG